MEVDFSHLECKVVYAHIGYLDGVEVKDEDFVVFEALKRHVLQSNWDDDTSGNRADEVAANS